MPRPKAIVQLTFEQRSIVAEALKFKTLWLNTTWEKTDDVLHKTVIDQQLGVINQIAKELGIDLVEVY